jgi:hypothetical protein
MPKHGEEVFPGVILKYTNTNTKKKEPYSKVDNPSKTKKNPIKKKKNKMEIETETKTDYTIYKNPTHLKRLEEYKNSKYDTFDPMQQYALDTAIEYEKSKQSIEYDNSVFFQKQITYLKKITHNKKFYLQTIFNDYFNDLINKKLMTSPNKKEINSLIQQHLKSLEDWKKYTSSLPSSSDIIIEIKSYYEQHCKPKQQAIRNILITGISGENFALKYEQLTTPLYYDMMEFANPKQPGVTLTETETKIFSDFTNYIESNPNEVCYVFSEDLDMILKIHTGIWRQLFNDGHLLMRTSKHPKTIETCGKNNATNPETELPTIDGFFYLCPGCIEKKLGVKNAETGVFSKTPGIRMAVDHCSPVKQAFITYDDEALCAQLTITCSECNGAKSDDREEEFIYKIHHDIRPVSKFKHKGDDVDKKTLTKELTILRDKHYIKINRTAIGKGIRSFRDRFKMAGIMTDTYITITDLKDKQIGLMLDGMQELTSTTPALLEIGLTGSSSDKLLSTLELFLYSIIDKNRGYTAYEELTSEEINSMIERFINTFMSKTSISLQDLNFCVYRAVQMLDPNRDISLYSHILPQFIFLFLGIPYNESIPNEKFFSLCTYMYKTHLDFVLYEIKKNEERGHIQFDPTYDYLASTSIPLSELDYSSHWTSDIGSSRQHHPDAYSQELKEAAKSLQYMSKNKQGKQAISKNRQGKQSKAKGKTKTKKNKKY